MAKGARPGLFRSMDAPIRNLVKAVKQDQSQMLRAKGEPTQADHLDRKPGRKLDLVIHSSGLKLVALSEHEQSKKRYVRTSSAGVIYRGDA